MKMNKNVTTATSAGIGGAIVGAGIATVATKLLSDKKTRDKAEQALEDIRNKISDVAHSDIVKKASLNNNSAAGMKRKKTVSASTRVKEKAKKTLQPKVVKGKSTT